MGNHFSILATRTPWTVWKGKDIWHWKMSPLPVPHPGQKVSNLLLGKSRGQLLIAPEGMKQLGQCRNDAQLWMSGGESQVWCCKEKYCTGTWNIRSMNQSKLDMVRQEMAIVNTDIFVISELLIKWMGMGKFNSDDHYIYYRTSL